MRAAIALLIAFLAPAVLSGATSSSASQEPAVLWSVPPLLPPAPSSASTGGPAPGPLDAPFGANVQVSDATPAGSNENEITLAVAPNGRMYMGWNDNRPTNPNGDYECGAAYSADGGRTWSANRLFILPGWDAAGDPVMVTDANSNVYFVCMSFSRTAGASRIAVYKSTDGGSSWSSGVIASDTTNGLNDKPWAYAVGTTIHLCYANFVGSTSELRYTRSTDGGLTWAPTQVVDLNGNGCQFASDRAGNLYLGWLQNDMRVAKSTNGGLTWGPMVHAASVSWTALPGPRAYPLPTMTADPVSGALYLAWHNNDAFGQYDIRFVRSTDGDLSWSAPVTVNDAPSARQFFPSISVAPNGSVHAIWYDDRTGNLALRYAHSENGGQTWSPSIRASDAEFPYLANPFIGDYNTVVADSTGAIDAGWCDARTGENEAFFATTSGSNPPRLTRIDVTPPSATTDADTPVQFTAAGFDQFGNPFAVNPTWAATGGTIAAGLYTPQLTGDWRVWANESGISGTATVHVTPGALARIDVTPADVTITADQTQAYAAAGYDAHGNPVPVAPTWGVSDGLISPLGLFAPFHVGLWRVYANASGISGSTSVTVTPGALARIDVAPPDVTITADDTQAYTATGHDAKGNIVAIAPAWSATGGTIDAGGVYTAALAGTWVVRATAQGITGSTSVTVTPGLLARIDVSPPNAQITADQTQQYTATGYDAKGNLVTITPTWSVTGGAISGTGLYTPTLVGVFVVTATSGTVSGSTNVTVIPGALARIDVAPPTATITADETQQFNATGYDAKGNVVVIAPTWAATCGSVDGTGLYHPGPARACTVYANESGVSGSGLVTVLPGALARIDVTPPTATITADETQPFTATGYDMRGNVVAATFAWSVPEGSIDGTGLYTPRHVGTWSVQAAASGVVGTATVTVTPGALAAIDVTPPTASITADETQQFAASGRDAKGNAVPLQGPSWAAEDGTIVAGLFTPRHVGSWNVSASEAGVQGTARVAVRPGRVHSVVIEPGSAHVGSGGTALFQGTAYDAQGNEVPDATFTWSVAGGIGSVDANGGFTGTGSGEGQVVVTATGGGGTATGAASVIVDASLFAVVLPWLLLALVVIVLLLLFVVLRRRRRKDRPDTPAK